MNIRPILIVAILSAATAANAASVQILHEGRVVAAVVTDKEVSRISAESVKTSPDGKQVHARGQVEIKLGQGDSETTIRAEEARILK
ncbi:hypothetical protein [Niveibacterium terrae]|uniref:hypothetical protein n=1 Tax=Niveibacterium terrae TaxID=3373598 RepID=UPI003A8D7B83